MAKKKWKFWLAGQEADQILPNSQVALLLLPLILTVCANFVLLIGYAQKSIAQKERKIQYQEELFDIFSTYLSRNTNDVYMLLDWKWKRPEYVSSHVERVLGIPAEEIGADLRAYAGTGGGEKEVYAMRPGDALRPGVPPWPVPAASLWPPMQRSSPGRPLRGLHK